MIWDTEGLPPEGEWVPVLWRSYGESGRSSYSIPRLVEEQAESLRERYLAWIYKLGESRIDNNRLIDHLELRPGFSYWWMTLIAEKGNAYKSLYIIHCLKLFVLEELIAGQSVSGITLVSSNRMLAQTFRLWCKSIGLTFNWQASEEEEEQTSWIRKAYRKLPQPLQAVIFFLRYLYQRWPLRQKDAQFDSDITVVDYLIHLDPRALTEGSFASNFWTDLVASLDQAGAKVHWLHHYIGHEAVPSPERARDLIARFNQNGKGNQYHCCLDGALGVSVVLATLRDYGKLIWKSLKLREVKRCFHAGDPKLNVWPLFKRDWINAMRGPIAILNCLNINMFERMFNRLPHQKLGIYLQENQGWEMGLIRAWRSAGHGQLIGVPHSTVRFWDLRYFFDQRSYGLTGKNELPVPDKVVLNGPSSLNAYRKGGYPAEQLAEAEALRYLYLADLKDQCGSDQNISGTLRILVLGDYLAAITRQQLQWLTEASFLLPPDTCYVLKPHPNCPVRYSDYPSLKLQNMSLPLADLLRQCNVVYTSNITSAAVDAYCAGVPVISMLDGNALNMSPLRGMRNVTYVTNHVELAQALRTVPDRADVDQIEPYFCLDRGVPLWRKLLEPVSAESSLD
jgi:surface carbohydrate biosynthesis protein (TIGR04326 family)